jgi:hypothetical protein
MFHGTAREQKDLLAALAHNCTCETEPESGVSRCCPGHAALVSSQAFTDHLLFARYLHARLEAAEFTLEVS